MSEQRVPGNLAHLYESLKELFAWLRQDRWQRAQRVDPVLECFFDLESKSELIGAPGVRIHDSVVVSGDVRIGEGTFVGQFCTLNGTGGLEIGRNCSIAVGARIFTHDSVRWAVSGGAHPVEKSPVSIGDCCFIGANAIILRGVSIGDHSVIGAGSVVTSDIPAFTIAAGVPARRIGKVSIEGDRIEYVYDEK